MNCSNLKTIFCLPAAMILLCCQHRMSDAGYHSPTQQASNQSRELTCKLSPKELQERKLTVLAELKKEVKERKELPQGYAFRFDGSDKILAELTEFIRTERTCCSFFIFNLSISGDRSQIWFELTGPEGAKDFITQELEL